MNKLTQLLLDWLLLKKLGQALRNRAQQAQTWLNNVKPFSWEAMLLLSLFSWFVYLLLHGIYAKKLISVFAWGFLMIGTDWALLGKQVTIPLIGFKVLYGPWITGAIACLAFLTNDFIITDWRSALISWPILSAVIAAYSRFIQPGLKFGTPGAAGRQDLVLLFLISGLLSCWFQFHFLIQDILRTYPNLLADSFERSVFVTQINPSGYHPANKATALMTATEAAVRQALTGKDWIETQRWLSNIKAIEPSLSQQVIESVYGNQLLHERQLWQITTDAGRDPTNNANLALILQVQWRGASSRPGGSGYLLRQTCRVSEMALSLPQTFEQMRQQTGFQLTCQNAVEKPLT